MKCLLKFHAPSARSKEGRGEGGRWKHWVSDKPWFLDEPKSKGLCQEKVRIMSLIFTKLKTRHLFPIEL